jgi:hypothetical protein
MLSHPGNTSRKITAGIIFCVALGIYLVLYLLVPIHHIPLLRLLLPDEVVAEVVGGDIARLGLLDRIPVLLATGLLLAAAWLLGRLPLQWLSAGVALDRLERHLFSVACGLGLFSAFTLLVGVLGIGSSPVPYLLLLAVTGFLVWRSRGQAEGDAEVDLNLPVQSTKKSLSARWNWLLLPLAVVIVLGAMLPPLDFDVREYHMQVPREWYQQGRITFLEHNVYGNMPLGVEILAIPAMAAWPGELDWWWGSMVGKTLVGCFSILTALMLISLGTRFHSRPAGLAAAVLYLSIPWIGLVSMNGLIEGALGFYLLATFAALAAWKPGEGRRWPAVIGLLAGAAAACKYPGMLWGVLPASLGVLLVARHRAHGMLLFSLGVLVGCGGWYLKNLVLTGNPCYPLLDGWFGGGRTAFQVSQWASAHRAPTLSITALGTALIDFGGRDSFQGMLLIPFAIVGLGGIRTNRGLRWATYFAVFFLVTWWLLTHHLPRFWVPLLPFIALLSGAGAAMLLSQRPRLLASMLVTSTLVGLLVISSRVPLQSSQHDNRLLVSLAELRDGPARKGDPEYNNVIRVHRQLNRMLKPDERVLVLLVGGATAFDLQVPVLYNTCFDDCLLETMVKDLSPQERRQRLTRAGITHVFVQWSEIRRYRESYSFTDFVTPELVRDKLVTEQRLLEKVELDCPAEFGELFIVTEGP